MTNIQIKKEFLDGLDGSLATRGFRRRRKEQEWRYRLDEKNEFWIHVNFGLTIVNPSLGVRYPDLATVLPASVGDVSWTMTMLQSISPARAIYSIDEGAATVELDLLKRGLPFLDQLKDRSFVIDRLLSDVAKDWPTISYSHRIRLLPLLLATEGRVNEACELLNTFRVESQGRDQMIPEYNVFANAFDARFLS